VPRLRGGDEPKLSLSHRQGLERGLQKADFVEVCQALARGPNHFGSGVNRQDRVTSLGETLCRLTRTATDFEDFIALLQTSV